LLPKRPEERRHDAGALLDGVVDPLEDGWAWSRSTGSIRMCASLPPAPDGTRYGRTTGERVILFAVVLLSSALHGVEPGTTDILTVVCASASGRGRHGQRPAPTWVGRSPGGGLIISMLGMGKTVTEEVRLVRNHVRLAGHVLVSS
jgi:hypothetical protein